MRGTIHRPLDYDARQADEDRGASLAPFSTGFRHAVAEACRKILGETVQSRGSCPFAVSDAFDRARCGLGLFALQHRLLKHAFARSGERREATLRRSARA